MKMPWEIAEIGDRPKTREPQIRTLTPVLQAALGKPCPYCDKPMNTPTRDHVYPRHLGGTRHKDNLLIVCAPCNQAKGAKTLEHFARSLTARRDPRAQRVWDLVRTRPSFPATETGAIIAGWEKARKTADRIAHRARSNGQESAP